MRGFCRAINLTDSRSDVSAVHTKMYHVHVHATMMYHIHRKCDVMVLVVGKVTWRCRLLACWCRWRNIPGKSKWQDAYSLMIHRYLPGIATLPSLTHRMTYILTYPVLTRRCLPNSLWCVTLLSATILAFPTSTHRCLPTSWHTQTRYTTIYSTDILTLPALTSLLTTSACTTADHECMTSL